MNNDNRRDAWKEEVQNTSYGYQATPYEKVPYDVSYDQRDRQRRRRPTKGEYSNTLRRGGGDDDGDMRRPPPRWETSEYDNDDNDVYDAYEYDDHAYDYDYDVDYEYDEPSRGRYRNQKVNTNLQLAPTNKRMDPRWHDDKDHHHHDYYEHEGYVGEAYDSRQSRDRMMREMLHDTDIAIEELWEDTHRVMDQVSHLMELKNGRRSTNRRRKDGLYVNPSTGLTSPRPRRPSRDYAMMGLTDNDSMIASLLDEAEEYLNDDPACTQALGNDIRIDYIHSQTSSAAAAGRGPPLQTTKVEFNVQGSWGHGTVQLIATERGMEQVALLVPDQRGGYRQINVGATRRARNEAEIVDAEII